MLIECFQPYHGMVGSYATSKIPLVGGLYFAVKEFAEI